MKRFPYKSSPRAAGPFACDKIAPADVRKYHTQMTILFHVLMLFACSRLCGPHAPWLSSTPRWVHLQVSDLAFGIVVQPRLVFFARSSRSIGQLPGLPITTFHFLLLLQFHSVNPLCYRNAVCTNSMSRICRSPGGSAGWF